MVKKYNKLVSSNESIQLQEVENGTFPWKTENNDEDGKPFVLKGLSYLALSKRISRNERSIMKILVECFCRRQVS